MPIKSAMRQNIEYRKFIDRDARGNIVSEEPRTIKGRKVRKAKWQRAKGEMVLVAVTQFMTETEVMLGDQLDGEEIYAVEDIVNARGQRIATKAFPRPPQGFTP